VSAGKLIGSSDLVVTADSRGLGAIHSNERRLDSQPGGLKRGQLELGRPDENGCEGMGREWAEKGLRYLRRARAKKTINTY